MAGRLFRFMLLKQVDNSARENMNDSLLIVPIEQIPKIESIVNTPTDDLLQIYKLCLQMEKLCTNENGIGLSAVQVGINHKLFIAIHPKSYGKNNRTYDYFVNCNYNPVGDDKTTSMEGCLSLKDKNGNLRYFEVSRYKKIRLGGYQFIIDPEMSLKPIEMEVEGLFSIVYQHEIDHNLGVLISDIGKEIEIREN